MSAEVISRRNDDKGTTSELTSDILVGHVRQLGPVEGPSRCQPECRIHECWNSRKTRCPPDSGQERTQQRRVDAQVDESAEHCR